MTEPTLDEIETHFHITASDRTKVEVFSDDVVWQRRLEKITQPIKIKGRGRWYELHIDQMLIRSGKRKTTMTKERLDHLAKMRRIAQSGDNSQEPTHD